MGGKDGDLETGNCGKSLFEFDDMRCITTQQDLDGQNTSRLGLCFICRAVLPVESAMILKEHLCFHHIALSRHAGEQTQKKYEFQASENGPNIPIGLMEASTSFYVLRSQ